jgi:RHS repeat-associated protein
MSSAGQRQGCGGAVRRSLVGLVFTALILFQAATASATVLPEKITENMTLSPLGSPYTGGVVKIEPGVTVEAGPGTVVKVSALEVLGTLKAEGTLEAPVAFRAASETSRWHGIVFKSGSGGSVLDHAEVTRAGELFEKAIEVKESSPRITNSLIRESGYYGIFTKAGSPEIAHDTILYCGSSGAYFGGESGKTLEVNFHDNVVEGCGGSAAVAVEPSGTVVATSLGSNVLRKNSSLQGIYYNGAPYEAEIPPDIPNNVIVEGTGGSATNEDAFSGVLKKSATWEAPTALISLAGTFQVPSGVTLTLKPGVVLHATGLLEVLGTLKAEGTAEAPVAFLPSSPSSTWRGIVFKPGSGASVLDHAEIARAGESFGKAIDIRESSPRITNSLIRESTYYGIFTKAGSPEIAHDTILYCGSSGAYFGGESGKTLEVNFHDNTVEGCGGSAVVYVEPGGTVVATSLGNNVLRKNSSLQAIYYNGAPYEAEIPPDIANNIAAENTGGSSTNQDAFSGVLKKSATWEAPTAPLYAGEITIASTATLNIGPGIALHTRFLRVQGTLKAEGTEAKPVFFTGPNNESAGEWRAIKFEPGSGESVLDYSEVVFGGSEAGGGMIEVRGSNPRITNSTLRFSARYGIKVTESGAPRIEWDRFRKNTDGLLYSGAGKLSAPNNDWGCASGPKPAGCGDSVSENVNWKPAQQLPELDGPCRGKESQCGEGADPVSLATGHLDYSHRDLLLTNKSSVPLEFARTYDSGSAADAGLGPGWSQTGLASAAELQSGEVMIVRQDGRQDLFQKTETGYKAPSGVTDTLENVSGAFQLTTLQGTVYRFDSSGRIASITDSHGSKTTYAYNAEGRLATITDPSGQTLTFGYNASNHITSVKDSTGREVKFAYSSAGNLESVTDALGGVTKYAYDSQHRLTQTTDPRGNVILKNVYDSQGRIVEQRDGLEHLWKLEYKAGETIVTEPQGGQLKYGFDSQNRVVSETDQLGHTTATGYDAAGNVSEVVRPGGAKWTFGHDPAGNLTSAEDPEGGERGYEYDAKNHLIHSTDARGNSWSYEWSAVGDLTKVADPEGGEATFAYNASGQPLTATDPDKHKAEFSWDARGNQLSATDPLGHKTSLEYNSRNYLISKTAPGLKAETFERDALGDLLARTTPEGHKTKYAYDANGLPTQVTDPAEDVWKIERNAMERPTVYTDPLGHEAKLSYNGNLQPVKVVDRRGQETTYAYDLANHLTEVARPEGEVWKYGYDARGNRSSTLDPRGHETTYEYDLLDRMTEAREPLEVTTEYGYDANGDLTQVTDPRGNATTYDYDKLGRLTEIVQPLETKTSFTYDAAGNQLTKTTALGALEYGYDAANRLATVKSGGSTLRSYGYDSANRLTSATDAEGHKIEIGRTEEGLVSSINDGRGQSLTRSYDPRGLLAKQVDGRGTIEYGYDKLGRMTSLTDPQSKALTFAYDPEGDLTEVTLPNGVTTANVFNAAGRLAETTSKAGEPPSVLESLKYGYDLAGDVTSKLDQRLESETTYAYDSLNRLTEFNPPGEGSTAYAYDAAGNRTEAGATTYAFNALNQPTEDSTGTAYSYDEAGRLSGEANGSEETTFAWDPFDHLAKVEGPGGNVTYSFDGLERLSERKEGEAARIFHYGDLGDMPTYETNGEGKTTTSYLQGPGGLVEQRSGEATAFPLVDGHGDVTAITNGSAEVESRQSFDPWGNQLSGPSLEMGYLGAWERPTDPTSSLIQMGARSYDPALGAFASEDPVLGHLGIGVTANRYPYVWNNPLNRYDLNGRDAWESLEEVSGELESGWEQVEDAAGHVASVAEKGWEWTAPGRRWISDRSRDFWKHFGGTLEDIYRFAGESRENCVKGAGPGALLGAGVGAPAFGIGAAPGAVAGGAVGCGTVVGINRLFTL